MQAFEINLKYDNEHKPIRVVVLTGNIMVLVAKKQPERKVTVANETSDKTRLVENGMEINKGKETLKIRPVFNMKGYLILKNEKE